MKGKLLPLLLFAGSCAFAGSRVFFGIGVGGYYPGYYPPPPPPPVVAYAPPIAPGPGYVWINGASTHYVGVPFGGYKQSGIGREESIEELLACTQIKNINVTLRTGR